MAASCNHRPLYTLQFFFIHTSHLQNCSLVKRLTAINLTSNLHWLKSCNLWSTVCSAGPTGILCDTYYQDTTTKTMFVALVLKGLFLITHTTSHFPHCDAFVISSEYTPTICDTNIWLWDINSPHLDSSSTPAKIFITLPLLLQSDMFAHDHNWSMMHSEKTKWSNIRFDSAGIGPLKWSTRAKSGGQSSCLLRCRLESHDLALSYTWVMNLMKLYVN